MNTISGKTLLEMFLTGAYYLKQNYKTIDDLNVFPVPDGDTGSNMLSTMLSGIRELRNLEEDPNIADVAMKFSKGLLFGARGNSGVILSQIFAGFASLGPDYYSVDLNQAAEALNASKVVAYKSVSVPVEGTILTVISDATKAVLSKINKIESIEELSDIYLKEAEESLDRTPLLLPVLKEAGVVDSGGAGFVTILRGMKAGINGEYHTFDEVLSSTQSAQTSTKNFMDFDYYELNKYGYCTEFTIRLNPNLDFNKDDFSKKLEMFGYSIVVVNTEDIVKVHIHSKTPGEVFSFAQRYGALCAVKAENMAIQTSENSSIVVERLKSPKRVEAKREKYGIVAVVNGDGLKDMFMALGVNEIVNGGQTMNPSTQDFIDAIEKVNAEHVFVIPNNKNVYMSARTAKALINDKHVVVVPAKTIAQGYAALTVFDQTLSPRQIIKDMETKIGSIESGEVTYAIRNSVSSGIEIHKNDFIGILDGTIINSFHNRMETVKDLIDSMITEESSQVVIFYGADVNDNELSELESYLETKSEICPQLIEGGQKIYSYIIEVE